MATLHKTSVNGAYGLNSGDVEEGGVRNSETLRPLIGGTPRERFPHGDDDKDKGGSRHTIDSPKPRHSPFILRNQAFVSGVAYCMSSCSMILLNKLVLSGFKWEAQISLMLYQNLVSVTLVALLSKAGVIVTEPLSWKLIRIWAPVNFIFVGMLVSSFFRLAQGCLKHGHQHPESWTLIVSAVCGGVTDLSFHLQGYIWQTLNCFFTAAYSLTLRRVMDHAKAASKTGQLSEFSMVLLNNSLSLPLGVVLAVAFNEVTYVRNSLVGSLNKIPLSIAGIVLFRAPTSPANLGSILFGCFAGVLFAKAKMAG
eukprot:jgi/Mesen1/7854/ME000042S07301